MEEIINEATADMLHGGVESRMNLDEGSHMQQHVGASKESSPYKHVVQMVHVPPGLNGTPPRPIPNSTKRRIATEDIPPMLTTTLLTPQRNGGDGRSQASHKRVSLQTCSDA